MGLWDSITTLPQDTAQAFVNVLEGMIVSFIEPMLEIVKVLFTVNIDPLVFTDYWLLIVSVISAFYIILFLLVGFKFLFGSYDAKQRAEAKEWAKKAVLLVLTVNASLVMYSLLLNLSSSVATTLWSTEFESLFIIENIATLDLIWLSLFSATLFLAVVTIIVRHMFLILGVMLFPIGLFLNFIEPLKVYGSAILNLIGGAAFMNVLDVLVLIAVQLFVTEFSYLSMIGIVAPTLGFLFVALMNITLFIVAILKALNSMGVNINVSQVVKTVAGVALA